MAITNPVSELEDENGNILGIAAKGLDTPVQFSLTGNVTGSSGNTDLSGNVSIPATIAAGAVTESKIATDAVTNSKVKDGELTKAKFNANVYNEVDGTIADGTNSNLATKTQVKAYVESVISSEGHYKGVQSVATINTWTASNLHNGDRVITSSDPAGSGTGTLTLGNLPVVDGQEVIFYVSDDQSVKIWQSSEGNYKIKQASKSDPTASGTAIQFIDSISQDTNGVVTATKKTVRTATASQTGVTKVYTSTGDSTDGTMTRKAISEAIAAKQPGRLVVSSDDNTAFSKISAAIAAGKDVWLNTNATYSGATYSHYVPLTESVFRSGSYTAFIFSRSRAYSDENGIVDRWTCNSSGWTYETEFVAYAVTAGTAGTAGTANSASNANLGKTTDATNGDVLYIGGGTQQRIDNAGHANSAKDYDQTGSIATALASKQPTVVFYGTSTGGTLSDPAISKSYLDTFKDTYVRCYARNFADTYDGLTGAVLSTIAMGGQRILDELFIIATNRDGGKAQVNDKGVSRKIVAIGNMYTGGDTNAQKTEYTMKPNRPYNGHSIPVYEDGWRKNVIFELTINNTDVSPEKIYLESGGAYHVGASSYANYTQSQIIIDGVIYGTSGNPTEWSDNYRYKVAIGSVPAGGSRTWQIVWWSVKPGDTVTLPTGSYTYYEKEFVVVTTIK